MGSSKLIPVRFDTEFYNNVKRAAELGGMNFSEFLRYSASRIAFEIYQENRIPYPDLNGWKMQAGGDYSEARAAKNPNYKKRNALKKIDATKEKAAKRKNKGKDIGNA